MKTVLVTGASGFIGTHLCRHLLGAGFRVRGVVRGLRSLPVGVERIVIGEIGPLTDWSTSLRGVDAVVHLAAKVHDPRQVDREMERAYFSVNAGGTETLAKAAAVAGVQRFLLASSVKAMAESTTNASPLTEDTPPCPEDAYGRSKLAAEGLLAAVASAAGTGMAWMALRLPLVYGPGAGGNLLRLMRVVEKGIPLPFGLVRNRRSLLALENCTDLLRRAIEAPALPDGPYLVSDGMDLSTPELLRLVGEAMGRPSPVLPVPPALLHLLARGGDLLGRLAGRGAPTLEPALARLTGSLCVDASRIRKVLGWTPPCAPDRGIRQMAEHFLANRDAA